MGEKCTFAVQVNGGEVRNIDVLTGVYIVAAAAVPAILGLTQEQYPLTINIWVENLLPDYGPYDYYIAYPGGPVASLMMIGGQLTAVTSPQ